MELSIGMKYVLVHAASEAAAGKSKYAGIEHIFCGLLKLSELRAEDISPSPKYTLEIENEIELIQSEFLLRNIDTAKTRNRIRAMLYLEPTNLESAKAVNQLLLDAENRLKKSKLEAIYAPAVLQCIFDKPTAMIEAVCKIKDEPFKANIKPKDKIAPDKIAELSDKQTSSPKLSGKAFLPELTDKIRAMQYALLNNVMGQDHVVHAFAEGMFSAEVLSDADESRRRPKAIFVFAGPPGVGKTFLAEQAAEALNMPFKRYDMSGYSDHQQHINLVGFAPSYKDAKEGVLTGFVKQNPSCILLFDEIEKAHINTIHLFLQILDAGRLHDDFLDEDVFFKDTIIIFTTNAGRQLYEVQANANAAGLPRGTILNALETDTHPQTGRPFFPSAICSRIATGWPLMFNHLQAHNLEDISAKEFKKFCDLFKGQYDINVNADHLLPVTLLYAEGGQVDARTLRAQTELFFKNEIFKLCRLFGNSFNAVITELKEIDFMVENVSLAKDVISLYTPPEKGKILLFADTMVESKCKDMLNDYEVFCTQNAEEAYTLAGSHDFNIILLNLTPNQTFDLDATVFSLNDAPPDQGTIYAFDNIPIAASSLSEGRTFFRNIHERLPELPIYLLETPTLNIDEELLTSFVRAGARGKLVFPESDSGVFVEEITNICNRLYLQQAAAELAAQRKVLFFETAPKLSDDKSKVTVRLRNLSLKRALNAEDSTDILDDVEKPNVHFDDVIGASDAKDELNFFIDYLKSPKKFAAQNLKPPKGVLLYGPPGTGKTLLARAMAGESDVAFIPTTASAFVTKYQGSGPEAVRALFKKARRYAPAIIFIDEIDAIGRARGGSNSAHGEEMALNALLTEMDGFTVDPKRPVFVLAATNFDIEEGKGGMGTIDAALARRFDRKILVDLPNKQDRKRYLEVMLAKHKNHNVTDTMIERLAARSTGMSLANLASVIEHASRSAVKKLTALNDDILEEAFEITKHGEKKDWGHEYLERVARHEAGHAFMCYLAGTTPAYLTIVARGNHGGYMEHSDDESSPLKTKEELLGRIRTSLGGRAAELVYYGEKDGVSSGASGDLQSATQIARTMICNYGMDESIGLAALSKEQIANGPMAEKISMRINEILAQELKATVSQIEAARPKMDNLVTQLLAKNKLTKAEIEKALE